ncbi:MAG: hypothetical protein JNL67_06405 [Planctomycetaceae bacterium]|nr:hypothetical protein [Planctomycetaceae bacterium]
MSARFAGVFVAFWAVVLPCGVSTSEAQVRQPQRLVHRPTQPVGYGFAQAGTPLTGSVSASPATGRVQQVGYYPGSYSWQENGAVQGEPVQNPEVLPQPLLLDQSEAVGSGYYESEIDSYDGYEVSDADFIYDDSYAYAGWGDCSNGACGGDDCDPCPECFWHGLGGLISNSDFRMGVQGFKNTTNRQQDGSFGFHGGINLGLPLKRITCGLFSGSLGVNSVQSNFAGSSFTEENRNQLFVTAALFRRVDQGLQGGVAYDFLNEDWYTGFGISQLRSELSWVTERGNSFGFRFTKAQMTETSVSVLTNALGGQTLVTENWVAMRQYRTFYRKLVCNGEGYVEVSAGHTDEKHTILALDFNTPLRNEACRFYGGFTYLLPQDTILGSTDGQETWNVAMGIQFTPYKRRGYCRFNVPLFDVADNGTFQVRRLTP